MTPDQASDLLTMEEAAKRLHIGVSSTYKLVLSVPAKLRSIKIGRSRRVPAHEIGAFIARQLEAQHDWTP